jgi:hypothetical protein
MTTVLIHSFSQPYNITYFFFIPRAGISVKSLAVKSIWQLSMSILLNVTWSIVRMSLGSSVHGPYGPFSQSAWCRRQVMLQHPMLSSTSHAPGLRPHSQWLPLCLGLSHCKACWPTRRTPTSAHQLTALLPNWLCCLKTIHLWTGQLWQSGKWATASVE